MTADTCTVLEEDWEELGETSGGRINDGVVHEVVFEVRYCKSLKVDFTMHEFNIQTITIQTDSLSIT